MLFFSTFARYPLRLLIIFSLLAFAFGTFTVLVCPEMANEDMSNIMPAYLLDLTGHGEIQFDLIDPVERSPERLRDLALDFAEKAGLRAQVDALYQEQEIEDFPSYIRRTRAAKKKGVQKKPAVAKTKSVGPASRLPATRRKKEQWDPRFSLPIPHGSFWLSSPFGPRKKANGKWGFHHGIDMAANRGTPIKAAGRGSVIEAGWSKGYGKTVVIRHDERFTTRYAHMDRIFVRVGDRVNEGSKLGCVGATGYVRKTGGDGSHLHFEVRDRGKSCNPFYFLK
ncbi:MAG: M24/M37 family peptidase [candidate division TM6 bacterium GW2011_GWF2_43_17]|nr:MAG: M24/M37 family peptidase [candidate division TM6 bacterium GW2011_GWF2_43_17]HAU30022.1 hypothetical protein [Candidatus Dependentiae bacterium]